MNFIVAFFQFEKPLGGKKVSSALLEQFTFSVSWLEYNKKHRATSSLST